MVVLHWYDTELTANKAVRNNDSITLYGDDYEVICRIVNLNSSEWNRVSLDGEWTDESEIPTDKDRLQADIDFLTMENEYLDELATEQQTTIEMLTAENETLTTENEQQQADIDYCLMLLEEE